MRTELTKGEKLLLYPNNYDNQVIEFEITEPKPIGAGGSSICYAAKKKDKNITVYGRLKELYPINCKEIYRKNGKLFVDGNAEYDRQKLLYIQSYNELKTIRDENDNDLFNNFVPYCEFFYSEKSNNGAFYVFTPEDKIGISFEEYIISHVYHDIILPINTVKDIFDVIISLVKDINLFHKNDLIHGDIKPNNFLILYDANGDFLPYSLSLFDLNSVRNINRIPYISGSSGFVAPETVEDKVQTNLSDIYSIGATLFYALTKSHYDYYNSDITTCLNNSKLLSLSKYLKDEPFLNELIALFEKCLAEWDQDRYKNCDELLIDLLKIYNYIEKEAYNEKIYCEINDKIDVVRYKVKTIYDFYQERMIDEIYRLVQISGIGTDILGKYIFEMSLNNKSEPEMIDIINNSIEIISNFSVPNEENFKILANLYLLLGKFQYRLKHYENSIKSFKCSIEYFNNISFTSQYYNSAKQGIFFAKDAMLFLMFYELKNYESSTVLAKEIIKEYTDISNDNNLYNEYLAFSYFVLGEINYQNDHNDSSEYYLNSAIDYYKKCKENNITFISISHCYDSLAKIEGKRENNFRSIYFLELSNKYLKSFDDKEHLEVIKRNNELIRLNKSIIQKKIEIHRLRNNKKKLINSVKKQDNELMKFKRTIISGCEYIDKQLEKDFNSCDGKKYKEIIDFLSMLDFTEETYFKEINYKSYNWLITSLALACFYYAEYIKTQNTNNIKEAIIYYHKAEGCFLDSCERISCDYYRPLSIVCAATVDLLKRLDINSETIMEYEIKTKKYEIKYYEYIGYDYKKEIIFGDNYKEPLYLRGKQLAESFNSEFNHAKDLTRKKNFCAASNKYCKAIDISVELLEYYKIDEKNKYLPTLDYVAFAYIICGLSTIDNEDKKEQLLIKGTELLEECVSKSKRKRYLRHLGEIAYPNLIKFYEKNGQLKKAGYYLGKLENLNLITPSETKN